MKKQFIQLAVVLLTGAIMAFVVSCEDKEEAPVNPALSVNPPVSNIVFSADGAALTAYGWDIPTTFRVESNQHKWDVTSDKTWVHIYKSGHRFTLSAEPSGVTASDEATLTVTAGTAAPVFITVTQATLIPVTGIDVSRSFLDLEQGTDDTLTASVLPVDNNEKDNTLVWESSDPSVATVRGGVVTAVGPGSADITVFLERNPSIKVDIPVSVYYFDVGNVALNKPVTESDFSGEGVGQNAVNGIINIASRWLSNSTGNEHWIEIDLQDSYTISAFRLYRQIYVTEPMNEFKLQYRMEASDNWADAFSTTTSPCAGTVNDIQQNYWEFDSVTANFVRLYFPPYSNNRIRLVEIEVYSIIKVYE